MGDHSTTIQLKTPDTENLDDTYVYQGDNSNFGNSDSLYLVIYLIVLKNLIKV